MKRILLIILFSFAAISSLFSEVRKDSPYFFMNLTVDDGLSQNSVFCITEGRNGEMWFATQDGLNRYDGYHFEVYRPFIPRLDTTIVRNIDPKFFRDASGNVWALYKTLFWYNEELDKFEEFNPIGDAVIYDMISISSNLSLVATDAGIIAINPLTHVVSAVPDWLIVDDAVAFAKRGDILIIVSSKGIVRELSLSGHSVINDYTISTSCSIKDVEVLQNGDIWIATDGDGVFKIKNADNTLLRFVHTKSSSSGLCSNFVRALQEDSEGNIWVGTGNGLSIIDLKTDEVYNIFSNYSVPGSLSQNSIKSIFRDSDGSLWLGTYYGGINYCCTKENLFRNKSSILPQNSFVSAIEQQDDGIIWVGTTRNGLFKANRDLSKATYVDFGADDAEMDDVKSIIIDEQADQLAIGTGLGGLILYDRKHNSYKRFVGGDYPNAVYSIADFRMSDGHKFLILGTLSGLFCFDCVTYEYSMLGIENFAGSYIYKVLIDKDGFLWIGSESGLYSAAIKCSENGVSLDSIHKYDGVSAVQDLTVYEDTIWVTTRNGLFSVFSGSIDYYSICDGLSSGNLKGIQSDSFGHLWISSEDGLNCLTPSLRRFVRFNIEDGLPGNNFGQYSHCQLLDGRICLGGQFGLILFNPRDVSVTDRSYTPEISSLDVNGENYPVINSTGTSLKPFQNTVAVNFSVKDYQSWHRTIFLYRIKGLYDDWTVADGPSTNTFTRMSPGKYSIELKSIGKNGVVSSSANIFEITIRPKWYKSSIAYLIYIVLSLSAFAFGVYLLVRKINSRNSLLIDTLKKENQENMIIQYYAPLAVGSEDRSFILKAVSLIEQNLDNENYSVEDLASALCMSRSNLHIKIKKLTQDSALALIKKVRMKKACMLLREHKYTVAQISTMTGFSSPSYFTLCFKKYTGVLPSQYI